MWVERNGPTWRVRDLVAGRKVTVATGLPTKTAAKRAKAELEADALRGEALVPGGGQTLVRDLVAEWWEVHERVLKPSSLQSEGARVRNHILPLLGHLTLDELCHPMAVPDWIRTLERGRPGPRPAGAPPLSPKTIRNVHGVLHKLCGWAVRQRLIRANPCADSKDYLPKRVRREMRFLTEPEVGRLVAAVPRHWRPLVVLLAATGLRWGEAVALRVRDVDVLTGKATVTRTLHELGGGGSAVVFTPPKTPASRRTVTFPPTVSAALTPLVAGKDRDDLVFLSPQGRPVRVRNFRRGWVRWTVAAGLDPERAPGERRRDGLRIHDLRHTHAAQMISAGVPLTAVQRRLGHTSVAITSDLYGHLLPVVDAALLAAVEAALAHVNPADLAAEVAGELATV